MILFKWDLIIHLNLIFNKFKNLNQQNLLNFLTILFCLIYALVKIPNLAKNTSMEEFRYLELCIR